jgi:hypothetical protein
MAAEGEVVVHFDELWNMAVQIFSTADMTHLGIMAVIIIGAAFFMSSLGQLLNVTTLALIFYAIANMVLTLMTTGGDFMTMLQTNWDQLLALDVKTLLVWFLSFGVLIALVHFVVSLVFRR